jgi:parallel beta-helix repeat protein
MKVNSPIILPLMTLGLLVSATLALAQGSLTPPGPPGPTMLTLSQIEPRTPISALPATITTSGSYYLTTNLTCTACTNGIAGVTIAISDVTLDLNGFTLQGQTGSGAGISVPNSERNLTIRNGVLDSWGVRGTNAFNSLFERLRQSNSAGPGLLTGSNCVVLVCSASANSTVGIGVGNNCTVKDCTVSGTSGIGILVSNGCVVADCAASGNSSDGINCAVGTTVRSCASYQNGGYGVSTVSGCTVIGCTASGNKGTAGIGGSGCTIIDCTASGSLVGIFVGAYSIVKDCTANTNTDSGILVDGTGCLIAGNTCNGNDLGIWIVGAQNRIDGNTVNQNSEFGIYPTAVNMNNIITRNSAPGNSIAYGSYTNNNDYAPTGTVSTATNPWMNF